MILIGHGGSGKQTVYKLDLFVENTKSNLHISFYTLLVKKFKN